MNRKNNVLEWGNCNTHEEHSRECIPNAPDFQTPMGTWYTKYGYPIKECDWCNNAPSRLFRYDGEKWTFCNKSCFEDYHGI